ncbi:MAG: UDP-N-acetylmuramoyl-tripeptide--D-alanyl-D-alanine ligase [Pseudomonadota bacterium]
MIKSMSLSALSSITKGRLSGPDVSFQRVSTDTRTLRAGDLYVALVGESFDGNEFTKQAFEKGACGAVVNEIVEGGKPQLRVADTTIALGEIARLNRLQSQARVVAVTGSQGKTTVKEMIGCILGVNYPVLITKANFNNHVGVPLTLLELDSTHQRAVIELGASGPGEIAYTVKMALPQVAVITNAAATHIEGFGDLQGVVKTKGEIIDGLPADGVAVLNADDANLQAWIERAAGRRVMTFGMNQSTADYFATQIRGAAGKGSAFTLETPSGSVAISLALLGLHNVVNAVAAAAASMAAGCTLEEVKAGLERVRAVPGRMNIMPGIGGAVLIDDSYNASPSSFHAAIDALAVHTGHRVLVVGDMAELGPQSESAHAEIGEYARAQGIDDLWSVGKLSALASSSFGRSGRHFDSQQALIEQARAVFQPGVIALVKGSRSAAMDKVVEQLKNGEPS